MILSTLGRKMSNSGDRGRRRPHTRPLGFPGSWESDGKAPTGKQRQFPGSRVCGLYTSTNLCCPKFRDHVNFDARAEWHLRHTDCTAGMDAPLPEHLYK